LELGRNDGDRRDIGVITLQDGPDPTTTLTGRVLEGSTGNPIDGAEVQLNGNVVAVSGEDGRFRVSRVPIVWGSNQILVGRLSYLYETTELWIADPNETFELSITLHPRPIEVAGVVVEGDRTLLVYGRRMEPFYERRESGFGDFITRLEIEEQNPVDITDLFRGMPGVILLGGQIQFSRTLGLGISKGCRSPLIYLDGLFVGGSDSYVGLNELLIPDHVEAIEVYKGPSQTPPQFRRPGSACGVIVIWTR